MSSIVVPGLLAVRKSVNAEAVFSGRIKAENLPRIHTAVSSLCDSFEVVLAFMKSETNKACVEVKVKGLIGLECQRCLQPVDFFVDTDSTLVFVPHDEEAKSILKNAEPWVVSDDQLNVHDMVEEEILLALPIIAMHEQCEMYSDCENRNVVMQGQQSDADCSLQNSEKDSVQLDQDSKRDGPFRVLENLKLKR